MIMNIPHIGFNLESVTEQKRAQYLFGEICGNQNMNSIKIILKSFADPKKVKNNNGEIENILDKALRKAMTNDVSHQSYEVVKLLIDNGARYNGKLDGTVKDYWAKSVKYYLSPKQRFKRAASSVARALSHSVAPKCTIRLDTLHN